MTITNISTFDKTSHKTTILYPYGSYFSPFAWKDSMGAFWEIHPLIDNTFNGGKLITGVPLLCDKKNGKFHYLLAEDNRVLHFASDAKINYSANIIFNTIKNYIARPASTVDELVSALSQLKDVPPQPDSPLISPVRQPSPKNLSPVISPAPQTSTVNAMKTFRDSPKQKNMSPSSIHPVKTEDHQPEKQDGGFGVHEKAQHETHESFLQRLLHFFSSLLCCFHHDVDEEPVHHTNTAPNGKRL